MKKTLYALSILISTIIGVGLFGLPYVASKAGFLVVMAYFVIIGFFISRLQIMMAEISSASTGKHQLPGYVEKYMGGRMKNICMIAVSLSIYGALLAYIIVGGEFLYQLMSPLLGGAVQLYQIIFFLAGALLIYQGMRSIAKTEFILLTIFLIILLIISFVSIPQMETSHLMTFSPHHIFLPYGVVVFSLWGLSIIPSIKDYLNGNSKKLHNVINLGILLCILIYALFVVVILGVTGPETTTAGLTGLSQHLSPKILVIGYIFGILTTFTSYLSLGHVLKESLIEDYQLPKPLSWFITLFIPLVIFSLNITNFIFVMNITGAIMLALQGILITLIYLRLFKNPAYHKKNQQHISTTMAYIIVGVLTLGIACEICFTIRG